MTEQSVLPHDNGADYVKLAKEALEYPSDFAWFGFKEMFDTWGFAGINKSGYGYLSDISNWECAIEEIKREFGEEAYAENFVEAGMSHWAVGSCDQLCVRILNREVDHNDIVPEDITPYFRFTVNMALYLRDEYPILDDDHYHELQWSAASKDLEDMLRNEDRWFPVAGHVTMVDGVGDMIQSWLNDYCSDYYIGDRGEYIYKDDEIVSAIYDLGLDKHETEKDDLFWNEWMENNVSAVTQRKNRRLEEAGQLKLEF